jgi:hypothetical protein
MSTTPNPTTNVQTASTPVKPSLFSNYMAWFKLHERLIFIAVGAYLLMHFYDRGLSVWQQHDQKVATTAAGQVTTDTTANKALTDQLAQMKADADTRNAQIDAEIKQATLNLQKQQAIDAQSTQQEIIARWTALLPLKPGAVQQTNGNDVLTPDAANQTVQALEKIPVLEAQVTDLNSKILIDDQVIGKQDDLITGLNKQLVDEHTSHVADVNLEKVKAKKSFIKGLKIGFVAGAAVVEAIHLALGKP